ncbi:YheC/YheD family endospore coat-associated protein [Brevibacillus daliensis]|uniref:YheC/YheD family endospore coat-associated protein n=1 Tax=Brevibacillus daliensis TaxID=2892995 RepID=UPI001E4FB557|nr:YheC/YheD family protein [Brevibacillus daliensis]
MKTFKRKLGILAIFKGSIEEATFNEKSYYTRISLIGQKLGIRIFVFSPRHVNFASKTITGFRLVNGNWEKELFRFPVLIYDRFFRGPYVKKNNHILQEMQNNADLTFLGRGLSGKWQVHQMLSQSADLNPLLPPTELFTVQSFIEKLETNGSLLIKPLAGTHGNGVVRIQKRNSQDGQTKYELTGRTLHNKPFRLVLPSQKQTIKKVNRLTKKKEYLIQPFLQLATKEGFPFDIRILVQKNGQGKWQTTGKAVRIGNKKSITSNLHGGGMATALHPFLEDHYPQEICSHIIDTLDHIATTLPPFLEKKHGRLVELGIDAGVDPEGNVWIIEVNSRPGRDVFRHIKDRQAIATSIKQPVHYARYLLEEHIGG